MGGSLYIPIYPIPIRVGLSGKQLMHLLKKNERQGQPHGTVRSVGSVGGLRYRWLVSPNGLESYLSRTGYTSFRLLAILTKISDALVFFRAKGEGHIHHEEGQCI